MTLNDCSPGDDVELVSLDGAGPFAQRLMELGLLAGRRLTLIRRAPLGDPLQVRIGSTLLAIRRADAALIEVAR